MTVYLHFQDNSVRQAEYSLLTTDCSGCCVLPVTQDGGPELGLRIDSCFLSSSCFHHLTRVNNRSDVGISVAFCGNAAFGHLSRN